MKRKSWFGAKTEKCSALLQNILLWMDKSLFDQLQSQLEDARAQVDSWEAKEALAKQRYEVTKMVADQHVKALKSKVIFDVGGTLFSTTKETLMKVKDSYFTDMFESGLWKPQKDGTYFIDRSPACFGRIVDYMRYGKLDKAGLTEVQTEMLLTDFDYFFPKDPSVTSNKSNTKSESKEKPKSIIPKDHWLYDYRNAFQEWLEKPLNVTTCLYKGSVDGFTAKGFHQCCDNQGPTLTVIQSTDGWIMGGYNPLDWQSEGGFLTTKDAFIFTLKNPNGIPPTRYFCKSSQYHNAVYNHADYGPAFTGGLTILHSGGSYLWFPRNYEDTTGFGKVTFTGTKESKLEVKEVEVYAL